MRGEIPFDEKERILKAKTMTKGSDEEKKINMNFLHIKQPKIWETTESTFYKGSTAPSPDRNLVMGSARSNLTNFATQEDFQTQKRKSTANVLGTTYRHAETLDEIKQTATEITPFFSKLEAKVRKMSAGFSPLDNGLRQSYTIENNPLDFNENFGDHRRTHSHSKKELGLKQMQISATKNQRNARTASSSKIPVNAMSSFKELKERIHLIDQSPSQIESFKKGVVRFGSSLKKHIEDNGDPVGNSFVVRNRSHSSKRLMESKREAQFSSFRASFDMNDWSTRRQKFKKLIVNKFSMG